MTLQESKDRIANEKGYPCWDAMFDFVCRDGQYPAVSGQLIEASMKQAYQLIAEDLKVQSFAGWSEEAKNGYLTCLSNFLL